MMVSSLSAYFYWILAPKIESKDENIDYYYDFSQSIEEYTKVFAELGLQWKWQPVTIHNFKAIIADIAASKNGLQPFVMNLCDGDDVNDVPGVQVIKELEKQQLIYSGADAYFYEITTSKIPMKKAMDAHRVPNAKWKIIKEATKNNMDDLQPPVLIKPAVSGGSMGVSVKNVVHTNTELEKRILELNKGYRGWNLLVDGLFAEEFIVGKEYTTFIIGNYHKPNKCMVYEPIERIFHPSLPKEEQFLSFDRLWEIYEEETAMPNGDNFYEYHAVAVSSLVEQLKELTIAAFVACKGIGYARIDFRLDEKTNQLYCLEVNAQCGLSEDENYTSIGAILRVSKQSYTSVIKNIIEETIERNLSMC
jgi:D-alanine-D-alanine ligase